MKIRIAASRFFYIFVYLPNSSQIHMYALAYRFVTTTLCFGFLCLLVIVEVLLLSGWLGLGVWFVFPM